VRNPGNRNIEYDTGDDTEPQQKSYGVQAMQSEESKSVSFHFNDLEID